MTNSCANTLSKGSHSYFESVPFEVPTSQESPPAIPTPTTDTNEWVPSWYMSWFPRAGLRLSYKGVLYLM